MARFAWLPLSLGLLLASVTVRAQFTDCSASRAQKCENDLMVLQLKAQGAITTPELNEKCKQLRHNFDCLLNYTSNCLAVEQRDHKARILSTARQYTYATCEDQDAVQEHWKDNACFQSPEVQRCNSDFEKQPRKQVNTGASFPSVDQCGRFMVLQNCLRRAVSMVCKKQDWQFLGLYLYDKDNRLATVCSADYRPPNVVDAVPTPAISAACVTLVQKDVDVCGDRYSRATSGLRSKAHGGRKASSRAPISDEENKTKLCCAFGEYGHCLRTAVKVKCSQDRNALVESILQQTLDFVGHHCDNYYYGSSLCSRAGALPPPLSASLAALLAVFVARFCLRH
ncbi:uncharacterized protein LOC8029656 isoform X2 [Ixodes scapularis]|uniref:uncharacterized protein LOC8029656 isoform X2 n=1 Tax=Ixodes scapularis TaxID=6945 RepID=UPI001C385743|nr:uncharacterized protein LOC8029656 isoform X2 [Ixodes scapularis]